MAVRWPQEGPKVVQDGVNMASRWPQIKLHRTLAMQLDFDTTGGPKMGLRRAQDGPKMAPRGPQDGPRWPQDGAKMPQDGPKMPQDTHLSQKYVDINKNTCFPDVFTHKLNQKLDAPT